MTMRRKNPRRQGLIGLAAAVEWFTRAGYLVSLPLNDSQEYDLIVDLHGVELSRVQVKTTTSRAPSGSYVVRLMTAGGNQSFHTRKPFDNTKSDLLFVLTDDDDVYVIPSRAISNRNALNLCAKYGKYRQQRRPLPR